jgi:hypothetical protein
MSTERIVIDASVADGIRAHAGAKVTGCALGSLRRN